MTGPAGRSNPPGVTRRGVLRGAVAGATMSLAATGLTAAQSTDFGGWLSDTDNYDGTVADRRGQSQVEVKVGTKGNGGNFAFDPPAVQVDPGTTVTWTWTGQGGAHTVHAMAGADFKSDLLTAAGATFEHPFDAAGVVTYQCDPHAALGMKGVVVVGSMPAGQVGGGGGGGTAGAQPDWGNWFTAQAQGGATDNYDGTTADRRGQDTATVKVGAAGNGGNFAFDPPALWVDPGTQVKFEWTGQGGAHNVVSASGPADLDSGDPTAQTGVNYQVTLQDTGINEYYCEPHVALGMKGAIAVGDVPTAAAGGGGPPAKQPSGRPLPGGDLGVVGLGLFGGLAGLAIIAVLANELATWFGRREAEAPVEAGGPTEVWSGVVRELDHDTFDPTGTAWLVALYFVILLVMWVFMYFVEFLGHGPTVTG